MNLRRKLLVAALGAGGLGAPFAVLAQQPGRTYRVGLLATQSRPPDADFARSVYAAFQQGMRELGHIEGRNLAIEWRSFRRDKNVWRRWKRARVLRRLGWKG